MTEEEIHIAVCDHLNKRAVPGLVYFHVPNGGKKSIGWARKLKRMGVKAGVSDLIMFYKSQFFALELKAEKGRTSDAQDEFLWDVQANGGFGFVAHGLTKALEILRAWGLLVGE